MSVRNYGPKRSLRRTVASVVGLSALLSFVLIGVSSAQTGSTVPRAAAGRIWIAPHSGNGFGALDCNGQSTIQRSLKMATACTDVRGFAGVHNANTWGGHFYDNGVYIGHDEPDLRFLSSKAGSGDTVSWTETLGSDPAAAPTVSKPGSDVTHYFELSVAPWFSMALCDPLSYPQLPCTPGSDANAPSGSYPGGGSSFLEMQFYPPGFAPFVDNISCNNKSWCASLHINDLECTFQFASCNPACEEPTNFGFIQRNGVPTGPPSPQLSDVATSKPNGETLMMNSGDKLKISISDAPVPGEKGQHALLTKIDDLTTHQTGFMQASGKNGFMATDMVSCAGTPFNYEPEYSTAAAGNIVPWAALQVNISTEFEIGHFEPCSSVSQAMGITLPHFFDVFWNKCAGPYEKTVKKEGAETGDAECFPVGDTHFDNHTAPNEVSGCLDNIFQNGDLNFDGTPYWADWPTSTTPNTFPSTFLQAPPKTVGGSTYPHYQIQTDAALSESSCKFPATAGCKVPVPGSPGKFYPYWTLTGSGNSCIWEFGNMTNGSTFGKDAQYGSIPSSLTYPELLGPIKKNNCT